MLVYWAKAAVDALSILLPYFLLYFGVKGIICSGGSIKRWLAIVFGILLCGFSVLEEYVPYALARDALEMEKGAAFIDKYPPHTWSPSLSGERRELLGYTFAQEKFHKTGTITTYSDRHGRSVKFVPSQQDIRDRDLLVKSTAEIAVQVKGRYLWMVREIFWAIFVVLGAVMVGLYSKRAEKCNGILCR